MITAKYKEPKLKVFDTSRLIHPLLVKCGSAILLTIPRSDKRINYDNYQSYEIDAIVVIGTSGWNRGEWVRQLNLENCILLDSKEEIIIRNE